MLIWPNFQVPLGNLFFAFSFATFSADTKTFVSTHYTQSSSSDSLVNIWKTSFFSVKKWNLIFYIIEKKQCIPISYLSSLPNDTIYFTRNVIFHFQLLSSTTFWLCAMSTWVVRATSCQKFAGNRSSPGNEYIVKGQIISDWIFLPTKKFDKSLP